MARELLYLGFNGRVAALDKKSGDEVWTWRAEKGSGFPALLLDGAYLFVSIQGYTYCLDAGTGVQRWFNPMKGYGYGVPSMAVTGASSQSSSAAAELAEEERRRQAASSQHHSTT